MSCSAAPMSSMSLVGLKMLSETVADLATGHPGCLVAAYCYQDRLFDREVRDLYTAAMLGWRRRFRERLDLIAASYPPRIAVDLDAAADALPRFRPCGFPGDVNGGSWHTCAGGHPSALRAGPTSPGCVRWASCENLPIPRARSATHPAGARADGTAPPAPRRARGRGRGSGGGGRSSTRPPRRCGAPGRG